MRSSGVVPPQMPSFSPDRIAKSRHCCLTVQPAQIRIARATCLLAALPTATNAYILAVRMTGDGRAVATQVTVGTVLSMFTIPFWLSMGGST